MDEEQVTWYVDGSLLDGPRALTATTGAGFAGVDSSGKLVAYGHGIPPPWTKTIPGVEAWAVLVVLRSTLVRRLVVTDCLGNVKMLRRGKTWATATRRPLARIWGPIYAALDEAGDHAGDSLVWMPAHMTVSNYHKRHRSDLAALTPVDHRANALVDALAKMAAKTRRVPEHVRSVIAQAEAALEHAAAVIGITCQAANNHSVNEVGDDGLTTTRVLRDSMPLQKVARAAAKAGARDQRAKLLASEKAAREDRLRLEALARAEERKRRRDKEDDTAIALRAKAAKLTATALVDRPGGGAHNAEEDHGAWWNSVFDEGEDLMTDTAPTVPMMDTMVTMFPDEVDQLFEPKEGTSDEGEDDTSSLMYDESSCPAEVDFVPHSSCPAEVEVVVTRSQGSLTAGLGAGCGAPEPVVGAEAPNPVTAGDVKAAAPRRRLSQKSKPQETAEDSKKRTFAEMWKEVKDLEAPRKELRKLAVAGAYRTPQQLNAQKQNERRAREKADAKKHSLQSATHSAAPVATKRVLDTVAEFWARKQARLASQAS